MKQAERIQTELIREYAKNNNIEERTAWRWLRKGKIRREGNKITDIVSVSKVGITDKGGDKNVSDVSNVSNTGKGFIPEKVIGFPKASTRYQKGMK